MHLAIGLLGRQARISYFEVWTTPAQTPRNNPMNASVNNNNKEGSFILNKITVVLVMFAAYSLTWFQIHAAQTTFKGGAGGTMNGGGSLWQTRHGPNAEMEITPYNGMSLVVEVLPSVFLEVMESIYSSRGLGSPFFASEAMLGKPSSVDFVFSTLFNVRIFVRYSDQPITQRFV